ncbi:thiamine pyrophosphate-binding protein [Hoeflea prorocentri]|uniref:Thiamine pyrophosphate-binding protein n=1 Tax=Hoeflea prorocentri TaxID=1922333 RepID=A0A9X3ZGG1_9HYPH|nr:thiamine pyrophosphate-binding protein [Hoeflea prorocentri]MCY6379756.1 thiamine pyrophosphate-binding protein [Hoeflea prorocentri]MDA5397556.1 thiamine pyrophosphate-binding protein [Hoeflea prorocentri]
MAQTVGYRIAEALADAGVTTMFGVISIHNMPILDAVAEQGRIRFIPARGEAGAMNMADAFSRVSGELGVALTSTGTAAGNAAGAQAEALTAGSRVLHITSTVDRALMDRDRAAIHDVPKQPEMLRGISKALFRIWDEKGVQGTISAAIRAALTPPTGPVSLEVPIDVQRAQAVAGEKLRVPVPALPQHDTAALDALAARILAARRPMLWLGGGARGAAQEATELVKRGFGAVSSTQGRGVVPESHSASLGAFNMTPEAEEIYASCDLMIVVGSRLRGNETRNNKMALPSPLFQIDAEPTQWGRNYPVDGFICGDAALTLRALLDRLPESLETDPQFHYDIAVARAKSEGALRTRLGPYQVVADHLLSTVSSGPHPWVRDVTISNSTFGNRYVQVAAPNLGVHALGGGIGQGIAMAVGAAVAAPGVRTYTLLGDGGAQLGLAELITAVDQELPITFVLMNDAAYGVIENIQDAQYGGRRHYSKLKTPDFGLLCSAIDMPHTRVERIEDFVAAVDGAADRSGPVMVEVDMISIGPFAEAFAGPPAGAAGSQV